MAITTRTREDGVVEVAMDPIVSRGDPGWVEPDEGVPPPHRVPPVVRVEQPPAVEPAPSPPPPRTGPGPGRIVEGDIAIAAANLGCHQAFVHAVIDVEVGTPLKGAISGFIPDGRPDILYESHQFHRHTDGRFDSERTGLHLSNPRWVRDYGRAGAHQWDRLEAAMELDREAALRSCSWGMFQVMGDEHEEAGFEDVDGFVRAMRLGQPQHLSAFVNVIRRRPRCLTACQRTPMPDFPTFARYYNGAGYRANAYDTKLADAFEKWVGRLTAAAAGAEALADVSPALLPPAEGVLGRDGSLTSAVAGDEADRGSPATPSSTWRTMSARWSLMRAVLGGTEAMRDAGEELLPRHREETRENYQERLSKSVLLNATEGTSESLTGRVFRAPARPDEDVPQGILDLYDDVDLEGTDLNAFARDVFQTAVNKGLCHVLVDMQSPSEQVPDGVPRTLADDREEALRPYWVKVEPEAVVAAYSVVSEGREYLTHVRILETEVGRVGWGEGETRQVRIIEPTRWEIWRPVDPRMQGEDDRWYKVREGVNGLGFVPLVTFYAARRRGLHLCKPPLLDLAYLNVAHWQSGSEQSHILTVTRFPILAASGMAQEEARTTVIGPDVFLTTSDAQGKWYYVEHQGRAIAAGEADLQRLEDQMATYGADMTRQRPGTQTATGEVLGDRALVAPLEAMAMDFQDAMKRVNELTAMWLKIEGPVGGVCVTTDLTSQEADSTALEAIFRARAARDISRRSYLDMLRTRGVIPEEFNHDADLKELRDEEEFALPEDAAAGAQDSPGQGQTPAKPQGGSNLPRLAGSRRRSALKGTRS